MQCPKCGYGKINTTEFMVACPECGWIIGNIYNYALREDKPSKGNKECRTS